MAYSTFGKFLAKRFLRELPEKGKGKNSRVFTDDLNGGPGWT